MAWLEPLGVGEAVLVVLGTTQPALGGVRVHWVCPEWGFSYPMWGLPEACPCYVVSGGPPQLVN